MSGIALLLAMVALRPAMPGGPHDFAARAAVQESLAQIHPRLRADWLNRRGIRLPGYNAPLPAHDRPDSLGLRLVGKWGRGPAVEVTGLDTLVALTLGSEVALVSFARLDSPRVLTEIQFDALTNQSALLGSQLIVGCNSGLEFWDVQDAENPVRSSRLPYPVGDFWARDTCLYFIRQDTFRIYSIADAACPRLLGWYRDSGYVTTGSGNTVIIGNGSNLLFADVSDPANPHRAGSYAVGGYLLSATARGNLCCVSYEGPDPYPVYFATLDIGTPSSVHQLGRLDNAGGYDIHLDSALAFVSGRDQSEESFHIISIADSIHPALAGSLRTTNERYNFGVWADRARRRAYVANEYDGLSVVDISAIGSPLLDAVMLKAASSDDVSVAGGFCYIANTHAGLQIVDFSDPTRPRSVGSIDSSLTDAVCQAVATADSFVYANWRRPYLRVISVADPSSPQMAGACPIFNFAEDMVLRDSFLYVAEDYRFQIVNVARPREPQVVGTLSLQNASTELIIADTLAYIANWPLEILSVADPSQPRRVGSWPRSSTGIDLQDTVLYVVKRFSGPGHALYSLSVADPAEPYALDSVVLTTGVLWDVLVRDTIAYCAGYNTDMIAVSVADPGNLRVIGPVWSPPNWVRRLVYHEPHIYACCSDAGICVLDTLVTGVAESRPERRPSPVQVGPSVTRGRVLVSVAGSATLLRDVAVFDVQGRIVARDAGGTSTVEIDLALQPDGVYVVRARTNEGEVTAKVIKTRR